MSGALLHAPMSDERRAYWRREVDRAANAVGQWSIANSGFWNYEDTAGLVIRQAERELQAALKLIEARGTDGALAEESIRARIAGAYAQIKEKAPSWLDPIRETLSDVKTGAEETLKTASTYGSFGAGAAIVVLGVLWYLSRKV